MIECAVLIRSLTDDSELPTETRCERDHVRRGATLYTKQLISVCAVVVSPGLVSLVRLREAFNAVEVLWWARSVA